MKRVFLIALLGFAIAGCNDDSDSSTPSIDDQDNANEKTSLEGVYEHISTNSDDPNFVHSPNTIIPSYTPPPYLKAIGIVTEEQKMWILRISRPLAYGSTLINSLIYFEYVDLYKVDSSFTTNLKTYYPGGGTPLQQKVSVDSNKEGVIALTFPYTTTDGFLHGDPITIISEDTLNLKYKPNVSISTQSINGKNFRGVATVSGLDAMNPEASTLPTTTGFPTLTEGEGLELTDIRIDTSGNISGQSDRGCRVNGSFNDTTSKKYLKVRINTEGSTCLLPNTSFNGVGYYDNDLGNLYFTALNVENGSTFSFGPKPFS